MRSRFAALLLFGLVIAGPARAGVVTVGFGGTFNQYAAGCSPFSSQPGNCATTAIASPFSGSFSYSTGSPGYFTGVTLTSGAFASLGLATTLTGVTDQYSYAQQSAGALVFGDLLGSLYGQNLATLTVTYPVTAAASLSAPPPLSAALGGTFGFVTSASPGGTGPSLSGTLSYFGAAGAAVPEAATWATTLGGVAAAGSALRRRRRRAPAYA